MLTMAIVNTGFSAYTKEKSLEQAPPNIKFGF